MAGQRDQGAVTEGERRRHVFAVDDGATCEVVDCRDHPPLRLDECCSIRGTTIEVDLAYPRVHGHPTTIEIDLIDTRAADGLRVTYDFERDGWAIRQASTFSWADDDSVGDADWQEVAFVKAWARKKPDHMDWLPGHTHSADTGDIPVWGCPACGGPGTEGREP